MPDKKFLISRLNYTQDQIRSEKLISHRKFKKSNVLHALSKIQNKALEFNDKIEEEKNSEAFDQESQEMLLINPSSFDKFEFEEKKSNEETKKEFSPTNNTPLEPQLFSESIVF